jgi:hypothetical protein
MQEPHQNSKHPAASSHIMDPQILGATTKFSCPGFVQHFALDGHNTKTMHLLLSSKEWTSYVFRSAEPNQTS